MKTISGFGVPEYAPDTIVIIRKSSFVYQLGGLWAIAAKKNSALKKTDIQKISLLYENRPPLNTFLYHGHIFIFSILYHLSVLNR